MHLVGNLKALTRGLLAVLACGIAAIAHAETGSAASPGAAPGAGAPSGTAAKGIAAKPIVPPVAIPRSQRAAEWYAASYGVDHLQVRSIASGVSLEFRYRVVDPNKAHTLGEPSAKPMIVDWKTGYRLTVPTMEQIGQLRQVTRLEAGRDYWMVFANPGKLVKPGDRVDVVVGSIRLNGLYVE